jgi:hypothetical protein
VLASIFVNGQWQIILRYMKFDALCDAGISKKLSEKQTELKYGRFSIGFATTYQRVGIMRLFRGGGDDEADKATRSGVVEG